MIRLNIQLNHLFIAVFALQYEADRLRRDKGGGGVLRQQLESWRPKRSGVGGSGSEEADGNTVVTGEEKSDAQRI